MLGRLNIERDRPRDSSRIDAKERHRAGLVTRLNHQRGQPVQTLNDLGDLTHNRFQFFHSNMDRGRVFKGQIRRGSLALGRERA